jgi:hypothetical protein
MYWLIVGSDANSLRKKLSFVKRRVGRGGEWSEKVEHLAFKKAPSAE